MAITTYSKITEYGIPATFWNINSIMLGYDSLTGIGNEVCTIIVEGYLSKKVYLQSNSKPLTRKTFRVYSNSKYADMFSEKAIKQEALKGRSIYDIAYDYIALEDPELIRSINESDCYNCPYTDCDLCGGVE